MARAILYTRVSTAGQAADGVSLEAQEARLRQYADFKGYDSVQVITDAGLSGASADRAGYRAVLEAVDRKECDAVIVYSLSRFARNARMTLEAVDLMTRRGVDFASLTEQLDTGSATGRFFITVLSALAQLEREQIGERTSSVLQHLKSTRRVYGQVPFGYRRDGDRLVIDAAEQTAIRLVMRLHGEGLSYSQIAARLEARGIPNKSGRTSWSKVMVGRIVTAHAA